MAGMFYSLQEAAERLNKTEEEFKQIVQAGKLREFRDGPNLLFKVNEVEALISEAASEPAEEALAQPEPPELEISELKTPELETPAEEEPAEEIPELEIPELEAPELETPTEEKPAAEIPELEIPESEAPELEEPVEEMPEIQPPKLDIPELEIPEQPTPEGLGAELLEPEEAEMEVPKPETSPPEAPAEEIPEQEAPVLESPEASDVQADIDEILLAPGNGMPAPSELTNADTALTGEGINVLGESDSSYDVTDDTMAETAASTGLTGATGSSEASLEEIESDVNLDSFGSGSGLLDLSLQADDTSLGGILDEIYTADDQPEEEPAEAGTVEEVVAEADQIAEDFAAPQPALDMALAGAKFEVPADKSSNMLGGLLVLPFVVLVYTAIAAISGLREVASSAVSVVQDKIWYVVIPLAVVAAGLGIAFCMAGKEPSAEGAKPKKAKKAKKPKKPKKEKKPKEPKKPKKKK